MSFLIDVYVLAPLRSAKAVERFLDRFIPLRTRAEADYTVSLDGIRHPATFDTPEELVIFCEAHPAADARAYWNNVESGDPHSAHVFFLSDGGLVMGLSVATADESEWNRWMAEMMSFTGAKDGYWTGECPPEDTAPGFVARARTGRAPDRPDRSASR